MPEHPYPQWPLFRRSGVAAFDRSLTVKTAEVGFEYLMGEHMQKDGASATASRLQFSLKYDLIY